MPFDAFSTRYFSFDINDFSYDGFVADGFAQIDATGPLDLGGMGGSPIIINVEDGLDIYEPQPLEKAPSGTLGPDSLLPLPEADIPGDISTTVSIAIGGSLTDQIEVSGDQDWVSVNLVAGTKYVFTLDGSGASPLSDPYLELMDASGTQAGFNDDGGPGLNSRLVFIAPTSGTYYLNAHGYVDSTGNTSTGTYTLTADIAPPLAHYTIDQSANFITDQFASRAAYTITNITYNIDAISPEAQVLAERAFQQWADLTPLTFTRVTGAANANITFSDDQDGAFNTNTTTAGNGQLIITGSAVNVNSGWFGGNFSWDSYTQQTFLHEIGHSLGLGHAGPYNGNADYGLDAIYDIDSWAYSVMSYFDQGESGYGDYRFVLGPQMADIVAIQDLYGVNPNGTRSGNTTYGFNSTESDANDFSNFTRPPSLTIYDTGGIDTLDVSGYTNAQYISLVPETFSDLGNRGTGNYNNVVAIMRGTIIENAVGGAGDDTIIGNDVANVLDGGFGADTLTGGDGQSLSALEAQVYRLYQATLDRQPDTAGLQGWVHSIESGSQTFLEVVAGFVNSAEFSAVYGSLDDTAFVTLLYQNVLNRAPDQSGLNGWLSQLASGTSREAVVQGFSDSAEFISNTQFDTEAWSITQLNGGHEGQVYRLYLATLDRAPDPVGFQGWLDELNHQGTAYIDIIPGFINSPEFQSVYGSLDDTSFVTLLYNNVLNRAPDAAGLAGWLANLSNGTTRSEVVQGFADSAEFISNSDSGLNTFMQNVNTVWNDTLFGGQGDDTLFGGRGADTFVFDASLDGSDTVYGLEHWDSIDMRGFGYASANDFAGHLNQVGNDTVFTDQGVTITFRNTTMDLVASLYTSTAAEVQVAKASDAVVSEVYDGDLLSFDGLAPVDNSADVELVMTLQDMADVADADLSVFANDDASSLLYTDADLGIDFVDGHLTIHNEADWQLG